MTAIRTELDPRFSDPDAAATSWEETVAALRDAEIFWITTVRGDGRWHFEATDGGFSQTRHLFAS